ncbi:MAG: IgGFc-binding protein, partial [Vulcanimicrobiaceae bacterium]
VPALKAGDADNCLNPPTVQHYVVVPGGAYHLVSSSPVIVYQFNALEYKGQGGPPGKSWAGCPGDTTCAAASKMYGCFSFSNDAALLLPSTAMTPNYRITGHAGDGASDPTNTFFSVTATQDATTVTATLGAGSSVVDSADGTTIPASSGAGTLTFPLAHAGDVAEIFGVAGPTADFSGSLVQGDKPIQVISGVTALLVPSNIGAADHTEQTVLPIETLGKEYVIPMPDAPGGGPGLGVVRFYGNADGTTLTYNGSPPAGCPTALNSGDVVECSIGSVSAGTITSQDIDVTGDTSFAVALFQEGGDAYKNTSATAGEGDPAETVIASVEQFRLKYLFLAPTDYDESYADIVGEPDAAPVVDDAPVSATFAPIGSGPYG